MDSRIENAILFISKYVKSELSLDNLASEFGLSKFHFHRLFKKEVGITPLNYINKERLEFAAHCLIMYPNNKLIEIAFESGFSSPAVFSRAFKHFYNQSPREFRSKKIIQTKPIIDENEGFTKLSITYLNHKKIQVLPSNLMIDNLSNLYSKLICQIDKPESSIGFYIDAPFHKSLEECRYYAGLETSCFVSNKTYIDIEEGYYTYFNIHGDFAAVAKQIIAFKEREIDSSPFYISSLVAFEKIKLLVDHQSFDYCSIPRTLYLKIKRR